MDCDLSYRRRQLRVLPLGDGSYQRFGGRPEEDTRDPGRFPISQDVLRGWTVVGINKVRGGGLVVDNSSLSSSDDPPLPTAAGGCVNRPHRVQRVLRTIPVAADNRQKN